MSADERVREFRRLTLRIDDAMTCPGDRDLVPFRREKDIVKLWPQRRPEKRETDSSAVFYWSFGSSLDMRVLGHDYFLS